MTFLEIAVGMLLQQRYIRALQIIIIIITIIIIIIIIIITYRIRLAYLCLYRPSSKESQGKEEEDKACFCTSERRILISQALPNSKTKIVCLHMLYFKPLPRDF